MASDYLLTIRHPITHLLRIPANVEFAAHGVNPIRAGYRLTLAQNASTNLRSPSKSCTGRLRSDGRFPPVLIVVVHTGHRPWRMPDDLTGFVRVPARHPLPWLDGRRYARLDLTDVATQYPEQGNRMVALAGLTFAESVFGVNRLFADLCGWLDFEDEDETRLYQCYLDWLYAIEARLRPRGWDPDRDRNLEELMAEQSILARNTDRWLERYGRELLAERLMRLAARRFGTDTGQRLGARLENVDDPGLLDRVGDLIVDCETGEQLLGMIDGAGTNSS